MKNLFHSNGYQNPAQQLINGGTVYCTNFSHYQIILTHFFLLCSAGSCLLLAAKFNNDLKKGSVKQLISVSTLYPFW